MIKLFIVSELLEDGQTPKDIMRGLGIDIASHRLQSHELDLLIKIQCEYQKYQRAHAKPRPVPILPRINCVAPKRLPSTIIKTFRLGAFSIEEHDLWLRLILKHGWGKWAQIAEEMPTRSRVQISKHGGSFQKAHRRSKVGGSARLGINARFMVDGIDISKLLPKK